MTSVSRDRGKDFSEQQLIHSNSPPCAWCRISSRAYLSNPQCKTALSSEKNLANFQNPLVTASSWRIDIWIHLHPGKQCHKETRTLVQVPHKTILDKMDPICFYIPRWLLEFLFCPVHDYLKSHSFSWNLYPQNWAKAKASLFSRIPRRPRSNMVISVEVKRPTPQQWGRESSSGQDTQVEHTCSCHGCVWGDSSVPRPPGTQGSGPPQGYPGGVANPSWKLWKQRRFCSGCLLFAGCCQFLGTLLLFSNCLRLFFCGYFSWWTVLLFSFAFSRRGLPAPPPLAPWGWAGRGLSRQGDGGGAGPSGKRRPQSSSASSHSDSSPPRRSYSLSLCRSWISFISSA